MKKLLLAILGILGGFSLHAEVGDIGEEFTLGALRYTITSSRNKTVSVRAGDPESLPSEVSVPSSAEYDGVIYSVTSVAPGGFAESPVLESVILPSGDSDVG
ncbi:MAG: hypothetical protein K2J15_01710 [Muribaculaceae bacterium]|nr:hypothetical protein [Muribaculaceae bacterium]